MATSRKKCRFTNRAAACRLSVESLESRWVLSAAPIITSAIAPTNVDEGSAFQINVDFQDEVDAAAAEIGLDPNNAAYTSLGVFDPLADLTIDTDTLTIPGFAGTGQITTADIGGGTYEIAVFVFDSLEVDAGITVTARGSRPLALLSQSDIHIAGTIDVSAYAETLSTSGSELDNRLAGPGGGEGGIPSANETSLGLPAAGAAYNSINLFDPTNPFGRTQAGYLGGGGGAHGGDGGDGFSSTPASTTFGGQAYGDLTLGITGGSGGAAARPETFSPLRKGGGGGGGLELGATGSVVISGLIDAQGGHGGRLSGRGGGGGAGGGILAHGSSVQVTGTLNAEGGDSSLLFELTGNILDLSFGGGGGGGRVLLAGNVVDASAADVRVSGGMSIPSGTQDPETGLYPGDGRPGVFETLITTSGNTTAQTYDYLVELLDSAGSVVLDSATDLVVTEGTGPGDPTTGSFTTAPISFGDDAIVTLRVTVSDSTGESTSVDLPLTVDNVDPTLAVDTTAVVLEEGSSASKSITTSDVPADTVSVSASIGTITDNGGGSWTWNYDGEDNLATTTVTIAATDEDGGLTEATFDLTVNNVDPTLANVTTDSAEICGTGEGDLVTLTADFSDAGLLDTHSATIDWGDGTSSAATLGGTAAAGTVTGSHTYADGGIYEVTLTLTDDDTGQATSVTTAVIAGVGLNNGVLQAVGTCGNDWIKVFRHPSNGDYYVHFKLSDGSWGWKSFDGSQVNAIEMLLGDGNDTGFVSRQVYVDAFIDGGAGDDMLVGGSGNDILLGGAGYDLMFGANGRDLLIGGIEGDKIFGSGGEDILIAGTTAFDNDRSALEAVMAEWTSSRTYEERADNLRGIDNVTFGDRLNGDVFLIAGGDDATVFDDEATDWLIGGRGSDLYFAGDGDYSFTRFNEIIETLEADAPV